MPEVMPSCASSAAVVISVLSPRTSVRRSAQARCNRNLSPSAPSGRLDFCWYFLGALRVGGYVAGLGSVTAVIKASLMKAPSGNACSRVKVARAASTISGLPQA